MDTSPSKWTKFKTTVTAWFILHPKVKAAAVLSATLSFAAFDNAYNGGESYRSAAHEAGGAWLATFGAYLYPSKKA